MIQRAVPNDPVLDRITQPIVEQFQPSRIILFGSRARGDARAYSDYDVLVELDTQMNDHDCWRALHDAIGPLVPAVNFFIRLPGQFDARADDPGTVDYDAAREGIVLYSSGSPPVSSAAASAPRVRERAGTPPESVVEWLASAAADSSALQRILHGPGVPWVPACFHAQQLAEKYLKAVIVSRWTQPIRTHDLSDLAKQLRQLGVEFPEFATEFELLFKYGQEARYPGHVEIPDEEAGRRTVEAGRRVVEAAKRLLPHE